MQEIVENNRMGKTRDLFKKLRDTKGTFSCKDVLNKGQKWHGPKEKQKILRRGGENTQKNCPKKDLHGPDNHDGVISQLT